MPHSWLLTADDDDNPPGLTHLEIYRCIEMHSFLERINCNPEELIIEDTDLNAVRVYLDWCGHSIRTLRLKTDGDTVIDGHFCDELFRCIDPNQLKWLHLDCKSQRFIPWWEIDERLAAQLNLSGLGLYLSSQSDTDSTSTTLRTGGVKKVTGHPTKSRIMSLESYCMPV